MLTMKPGAASEKLTSHRRRRGATAAIVALAALGYALLSRAELWSTLSKPAEELTMNHLGEVLLSTEKFGYLLPFEAVSVLLLACIIGGVVVARKR
jgi:NADH-quinone oxidoreductase subunit J